MSVSQDEYVCQLLEQVSRLQTKLGELHCTDANSLRRAYKTIYSQIQALEMESQHISGLLQSIQSTSFSPERLGKDFTVAFSIGVGVLGATRLLRSLGAPVRGIGLHVSDAMSSNRRVKAQLVADWSDIRSRIELMLQLSQSGAALLCPAGTQTSLPEGLPLGGGEGSSGVGAYAVTRGPGSLDPTGSLFVGQNSGEVVSPGGSERSGEHVEGGTRSPGLVGESFTSGAGSCVDGRLYSTYPLVPTSMPNSPGYESRSVDRQLQSGYEMLTHEKE